MYLSCTKGDLRLPSRGMPRFVLGINSQLVEIDSNRRLSRIVRNLTKLPSIVVSKCKWNGSEDDIINGYGCYCYAT